jgi:Flp pilus assembly protein TadG
MDKSIESGVGEHVNHGCESERGQALLEFAFLLPVLMMVLLGMIVFGIAMNNYLELSNGAAAGAQAISISRGQTTDPCGTAAPPFHGAAPNLTTANLSFTFTITPPVGSTATAFGPATMGYPPTCTGAAASMVQGATAQVSVTYPCNLKVFGINYAPGGCTMTAQTAEAIQ